MHKSYVTKGHLTACSMKLGKLGLEGTSSSWDAVVRIMFNSKRLNAIS